MQFKLTYTVSSTFEIPDGAVKVERLDTPPVQPPKYETNMDAVD